MVSVSIIIPVYNSASSIGRTLDSVLAQSLREIEVICVNDGSTDESREVIAARAKQDNRIVVISQPNSGAAVARNRALDSARGRYVAFMDADDLYPQDDVIERLYAAAETQNAKICGGGVILRSPDGRERTRFAGDEAWMNGFGTCGFVQAKDFPFDCGFWRFIYDRSLFADGTIRFPDYRLYEDPPFFVQALAAAGALYGVNFPTYVYCASPRQGRHSIEGNVLNARDYIRGLTDVLSVASKNGMAALCHQTWSYCCSAPFRTSLGRWPYDDPETFNLLCRLNSIGAGNDNPMPLLDEMRQVVARCSRPSGALSWCAKALLRRAKVYVGRHVPDRLKFWRNKHGGRQISPTFRLSRR